MTGRGDQIDEFESRFKRAQRESFVFADVPIKTVALITDRTGDESETIRESLSTFLPRLETVDTWRILGDGDYRNVAELLNHLDAEQTDLIITYRHLQEGSLVPQHSLGVYLDVLTQTSSIPVLVLPGTAAEPKSLAGRVCNRVMVVTDHISGDNRLINYSVRMCASGGTIWLCHVEDDAIFNRYLQVIEKIPEIETDQARELIGNQLLKEANDFIETCIAELREQGPNISYQSSVTQGHHLSEYRELIETHDVDLLVANTKNEDQLAMHGMTYSISVELADVAMLLL
ncbi:MAG: hypothetical protein IID46_10025 [Planctomycetes bacterium]|nr:hypothetical protein [Planctomycetota bacterium]